MAEVISIHPAGPAEGPSASTGGYEGASRTSRELLTWTPSMRSPDLDLNREKPLIDARARDQVKNDGYALGAVATHRDSIVGSQYVLNAQPDWRALGADEAWAEEFQRVVESRFALWAESADCWPDAARRCTFTGLVRMAVCGAVLTGEVLATAEWLRNRAGRRPYNTAIQMVDPDRLSNPDDRADTRTLRRGVQQDKYGAAEGYWFRQTHPSEAWLTEIGRTWKYVPATKPWGRVQVIHIYEPLRPEQSRGVADMVAALKQMRMTSKFQDVTLQAAVLNATYAASIESEVPPEVLASQLSGDGTGLTNYLGMLAEYAGASKALHVDGVKIPTLFPGTKLHFQRPESADGIGDAFEESLLRKIAASLGLSYEQLSRDYTKTNYSSARASMVETWKSMQAKKRMFADRFADHVYALWLEEAIGRGEIPLPAGRTREWFYEGLNKEALTRCEWIGAARGQIDELKETQAAALRIDTGLSTYEAEISRTGKDFRRVFEQRKREQTMIEELGLTFGKATTANSGSMQNQPAQPDDGEDE